MEGIPYTTFVLSWIYQVPAKNPIKSVSEGVRTKPGETVRYTPISASANCTPSIAGSPSLDPRQHTVAYCFDIHCTPKTSAGSSLMSLHNSSSKSSLPHYHSSSVNRRRLNICFGKIWEGRQGSSSGSNIHREEKRVLPTMINPTFVVEIATGGQTVLVG